jgi:hypothetical protein
MALYFAKAPLGGHLGWLFDLAYPATEFIKKPDFSGFFICAPG